MGRPRKNPVVEPAKAEEVKAAVVEAATEPVKEEKKEAVKKTAKKAAEKVTKSVAKAKDATKKAVEKVEKKAKASKVKVVVKVQAFGNEYDVDSITAKAKKLAGKDVSVYIKPEDGKAYYVGEGVSGDFEL